MEKKVYKVKNMSCAACVSNIEETLTKKGYKGKVNFISEKLVVFIENDDKELYQIMNNIGYDIVSEKEEVEEKDYSKIILPILFIAMVIIMLNISPYLKLLISIITIILSKRILIDGYKKTINLAFNMNSLIFIGVISSFLYSLEMLAMKDYNKLYFDGIAVILFVINIGNYIESRLKKTTRLSVESITNLLPSTCNILVDGKVNKINISELKKGDILVVKEGEIIASDGIIIKGSASINESSITGESKDILKEVNDRVIGSSIIVSGQINIEVTEVGEDTVISKIADIMQMTQEIKPNIARIADKVAMYFVPIVITIATITGIAWYVITKDFSISFNNFASVILISCPCSIGLATPASISIGVGLLAKKHILLKKAEALENGYKITDIVMDKTGTLTNGTPTVVDILLPNEDISMVYSIEKYVDHPISHAIVNYLEEKYEIIEKEITVRNFQGLGVFSSPYLIGNKKLMDRKNIDINEFKNEYDKFSKQGKTFIFIAKNEKIIGYLTLIDNVKNTSIEFINNLKRENINSYMLTGDNKNTAKYIADQLGIDKVYAEVLPYEKSSKIEEIKSKDNHVVMVGDGINDALALSTADIGIAISKGSDIAIKASDIILLRNNLNDIITFKNISKATMKNIKENLFFGFIYNIFGIVIATGLLGIELTPMIASICMVLSSISVLLNALRLKLYKI